jgi:hypothetical protein
MVTVRTDSGERELSPGKLAEEILSGDVELTVQVKSTRVFRDSQWRMLGRTVFYHVVSADGSHVAGTRPRDTALTCEVCGLQAETMQVELRQNVGLVVHNRDKSIKAEMCRTRAARSFGEPTAITLLFGWWSPASIILAPCFIVGNLVTLVRTRSLASPPRDAEPVRVSRQTAVTLRPFRGEISFLLGSQRPRRDIAYATWRCTGVPLAQAARYVDICRRRLEKTVTRIEDMVQYWS